MKNYFRIAKWIIIIGGLLYISLAIFSIIMVGSSGHNTGIKTSTIFVCLLMVIFLSFTNKFEYFGNRIFEILNWLTIGLIIWVMGNIINGNITDYYKGEELTLILSISIPFILFSTVIIGLIKKLNKINKIWNSGRNLFFFDYIKIINS